MATIKFYEKTGCINNTKQKRLLELAGHTVEAINLTTYKWTKEELLTFFKGIDTPECINPNAPAVTSNEVSPCQFTKEGAVEAMIADPLLIKRPLMIIDGKHYVGFDKEELDKLIGLTEEENDEVSILMNQNIVDCPNKSKSQSCD